MTERESILPIRMFQRRFFIGGLLRSDRPGKRLRRRIIWGWRSVLSLWSAPRQCGFHLLLVFMVSLVAYGGSRPLVRSARTALNPAQGTSD
jgi:hypothetical protein